jgi:hypothetical protein
VQKRCAVRWLTPPPTRLVALHALEAEADLAHGCAEAEHFGSAESLFGQVRAQHKSQRAGPPTVAVMIKRLAAGRKQIWMIPCRLADDGLRAQARWVPRSLRARSLRSGLQGSTGAHGAGDRPDLAQSSREPDRPWVQ